jgi:hypothetical protein
MKILIIILLTIIILYFYIVFPAYVKRYTSLPEIKDYCAILTSVSAILLGIFYYFHKLNTEDSHKKKEIRKQRLNLLLTELNTFDNHVDQLLNKQFKDDSTLSFLRNKISRSFEIIEILIKQNRKELTLSTKDIDTILEVNSFIDKSEIIMRIPYEDISQLSLYEIKDIYIEKIKDAKRLCFIRSE